MPARWSVGGKRQGRVQSVKRENRQTPRREASYRVFIVYGEDKIPVPCVLLDISETGARLELPGNEDVPADFDLLLSATGRARRKCVMAWRSSKQVGVRFILPEK
jgi:PilZ domain